MTENLNGAAQLIALGLTCRLDNARFVAVQRD